MMNWEKVKTKILIESGDTMARTNENGSDGLQKIVTPSSLIIIDKDVIKTYINANTEFSDESADENINLIWDLIKDGRFHHVVIPDPTAHVTVDAGEYMNDKFESVKIAEALVIRTLGHRILAQMYIKIRKHLYPVRVFSTEQDALRWFEKLRKAT